MSIYNSLVNRESKVAVLGLGYVGLPLALEFAKYFDVIGFDIDADRIEMMKNQLDPSQELEKEVFDNKSIHFTISIEDLSAASIYIITVPTPVNEYKVPIN